VGADVEPGADGLAVAVEDQRFGIAFEDRLGLGEAAIGELVHADERAGITI
jgi:hypothetical protein